MRAVCHPRGVEIVVLVGGLLSLVGVLVWIGLLLWAAREDGRDQRRRDEG